MDPQDSRHLEHFPFLARMEVLPEWDRAARFFLAQGGTAMVLGGPDTGKSTLSRYLVYRAFAGGGRVALVDLDLGQSHLGPPATLGLGLFPPRLPGDEGLFPEGLYFIGQTSPVGAILEVVVGCRVLVDQAVREGFDRVVVNTSGFVQGPAAVRLKRAQVELLNPSLIFALERNRELEPLLRGLAGAAAASPAGSENSPLGAAGALRDSPEYVTPAGGRRSGWTVSRLPVSRLVVEKTTEERRRYRQERFRQYFSGAGRLTLPWASLVCEGLPLGQGEALDTRTRGHLQENLGVEVHHGEFRDRRAFLLLAEPPPQHFWETLKHWPQWEKVHWISWPALQLRLVGLTDATHATLALGLILPVPWNPEGLALWTPLNPAAAPKVCFLKVGKMKLSLEGRELPYG